MYVSDETVELERIIRKKMRINRYDLDKPGENFYEIICDELGELEKERILKTISIMKSLLKLDCAPVHIERLECIMTPSVKTQIITASKKLNMFGKTAPFVASFDEYGRRLPDESRLEVMQGMTVKIVDPDVFGECYLELKAYVQKT